VVSQKQYREVRGVLIYYGILPPIDLVYFAVVLLNISQWQWQSRSEISLMGRTQRFVT
jgi:hypothetical protein